MRMRANRIRTVFGICLVFALLFVAGSWAQASSESEIKGGVNRAIQEFYREFPDHGREWLSRATGFLVFHGVIKGGLGIGGEYGEGALLVNGSIKGYYNIAAGSVGLQAGARKENIIIAFMSPKDLQSFENSSGWRVGVNAAVTLITTGAGGQIDLWTANEPVVAVAYDEKGLMYNATIQGAKVTRIHPQG